MIVGFHLPAAGGLSTARAGPIPLVTTADGLSRPATLRATHITCQAEEPDKRLLKPTGDPRLFWLDELIETPAERAERDREKQKNMQKWGNILSQADSFDEDLAVSGRAASGGSNDSEAASSEWLLVGASAPILLALLSKFIGVW